MPICIDTDPLFANPDNGDFHLKSEAGGWDQMSESWVADVLTRLCLKTHDFADTSYIR